MQPVRPAIGQDDSRNEHAVLAAMLADPELLRLGSHLLKKNWFVDGRHTDVFVTALTIAAEGKTADLVEVAHRLRGHDLVWLTGLSNGGDAVGFEVRCKAIAKAHKQRLALGKIGLADAASPEPQRAEALAQASQAIAAVNASDGDRVIDWPVTVKGKPSKLHLENTAKLLEAYGVTVRHNLMSHRLEIDIPGLTCETEVRENRALSTLIEYAERNGLAEKQTLSHLQILAVPYHPVWMWISSRHWDGVNRLPDLLSTIELSPGSDADLCGMLLHRWLCGCVKAVMPRRQDETFRPQGVLTLQGGQGLGKSRWLEALAPPGSGWVLAGTALDPHDRDSISQMTSVWIAELAELDGTLDRAHIAGIKAFVDRPSDTYRRPYARSDECTPRRTMMAGSVNPKAFLADDTGSRRWWCLSVVSIMADHGIDVQQLWDQVAELVRDGARWWLDRDEQARLTASNLRHTVADPLIEDLWRVYEAGDDSCAVTVAEIWSELRDGRRTWTDARKLAQALDRYRTGKVKHGSDTFRLWKRGQSTYGEG